MLIVKYTDNAKDPTFTPLKDLNNIYYMQPYV